MIIRVKHGVTIVGGQPLEVAGVFDGADLNAEFSDFWVEEGCRNGRYVVYHKSVWEAMPVLRWTTPAVGITKDSALTVQQPDGSWKVMAELPPGYRWEMRDGHIEVQRLYSLEKGRA